MRSNMMAIASVLTCLLAATAGAESRPRRPAGTVALTAGSLSGSGPALVKKVRKASAARAVFVEDEDDKGWRVHYALAVPHALPSSEITLKLSDVSRPRQPKQPVCAFHKIIYSEAAVTRGSFLLTRDEVLSPNAQLLLEIESDGELIARQTFQIRGEVVAGARTIDFSEDDGGEDEVAEVRNRRR